MPLVVRQALASRLSSMPELQVLMADVRLLAGMPVRFWPAAPETANTELGAEPVALCARLARAQGGCQMCTSLRQKTREAAVAGSIEKICDAGLIELLVPVKIGGVVAGHFLISGLRPGTVTTQAANRARHLLAKHGAELRAEELMRYLGDAPLFEADHRQALTRVLEAGAERIGRTMTEHLVRAPQGASALVQRIYRVVHTDYARPLRVPALAKMVGVSTAHLSRLFHHTTGLRLVDYVARYRAEKARTLLADSEQPIAMIARASGFSSVSQFNRVFKATYGSSPRALRCGLSRPTHEPT
jgi:AraC-like DNA-binding protein/ligand-binding sensor protein